MVLGATDPAITVALITAVLGPIVVLAARTAAKAAMANVDRRGQQIEDRIGEPNGHGNLVQMMEKLLSGQTGQDARLASIDDRIARGDEKIVVLGTKISAQGDEIHSLARRVGRIETSCQFIAAHVHDDDDGDGVPVRVDAPE
jgi:hypothetical protein